MKGGLTMTMSRCPYSEHTANPSYGSLTTGRLHDWQ